MKPFHVRHDPSRQSVTLPPIRFAVDAVDRKLDHVAAVHDRLVAAQARVNEGRATVWSAENAARVKLIESLGALDGEPDLSGDAAVAEVRTAVEQDQRILEAAQTALARQLSELRELVEANAPKLLKILAQRSKAARDELAAANRAAQKAYAAVSSTAGIHYGVQRYLAGSPALASVNVPGTVEASLAIEHAGEALAALDGWLAGTAAAAAG